MLVTPLGLRETIQWFEYFAGRASCECRAEGNTVGIHVGKASRLNQSVRTRSSALANPSR